MTIIAVRHGVIATDSGMWNHDWLIPHSLQKLRVTDLGIIAGAGIYGAVNRTIDWLDKQWDKPKWDDLKEASLILLTPEGKVRFFDEDAWFDIDEDWFSYGSGMPVANGALYAGGSAVQAVEAAIKYSSPNCVGPINVGQFINGKAVIATL